LSSEDKFVKSVLAKVHGWLAEEDKPRRSGNIEKIKALQRRLSRGDPFYEPVERVRANEAD
jgi:hypothetical protein